MINLFLLLQTAQQELYSAPSSPSQTTSETSSVNAADDEDSSSSILEPVRHPSTTQSRLTYHEIYLLRMLEENDADDEGSCSTDVGLELQRLGDHAYTVALQEEEESRRAMDYELELQRRENTYYTAIEHQPQPPPTPLQRQNAFIHATNAFEASMQTPPLRRENAFIMEK